VDKNKYFKELERRFGKVQESDAITAKFGNYFFDGILGWQFPDEVIMDYNGQGKLLTMDLDVPSSCKLNCVYCFAKEDAYYRPMAGQKPLSFRQIMSVIKEAKQLGLKSIKIVGFGESLDNPAIFDFLEFTAKEDVVVVIFTSLYTLGEKRFGGNKRSVVDFLYNRRISLMVKYHTLDRKKDDRIVGMRGYAKERDENLCLLLRHGGFNNQSPTRLGIECVIAQQNVEELAAIYEYFKIFRNVHTDIDPPIPVGRTSTREKWEQFGLNQVELVKLFRIIYGINKRHSLPFKGVSPFMGNPSCSQLPNGLYLTLSGKVVSCCGGDEEYGDIHDYSLRELFIRNPYRLNRCYSLKSHHDCPYRKRKGIITDEIIGQITREFS
jgi:MoaA/NifB/PqqE/SkfB family radical SAM enzyme